MIKKIFVETIISLEDGNLKIGILNDSAKLLKEYLTEKLNYETPILSFIDNEVIQIIDLDNDKLSIEYEATDKTQYMTVYKEKKEIEQDIEPDKNIADYQILKDDGVKKTLSAKDFKLSLENIDLNTEQWNSLMKFLGSIKTINKTNIQNTLNIGYPKASKIFDILLEKEMITESGVGKIEFLPWK